MTRLPNDRYDVTRRIYKPEPEDGGRVLFMVGTPGSGKTSVALHMAEFRAHTGSRVLWRGSKNAQWSLYPGGLENVRVWVEKPWELDAWRAWVDEDRRESVAHRLSTHRFETPQELIQRAEPGVLNVVYAKEENRRQHRGRTTTDRTWFWAEVCAALRYRERANWYDLFIDEAHEMLMQRARGEQYHTNSNVASHLAQFRKSLTFAWLLTHEPQEIWDEIRNKRSATLWFQGANPREHGHPKLVEKLWKLRRLDPGEHYLDANQLYGYFCKHAWYPDVPSGEGSRPGYKTMARLMHDPPKGERVPVREVNAARADGRWIFARDWREAYRLYEEHEELTQTQVADMMGVSQAAVSQRFQRYREESREGALA